MGRDATDSSSRTLRVGPDNWVELRVVTQPNNPCRTCGGTAYQVLYADGPEARVRATRCTGCGRVGGHKADMMAAIARACARNAVVFVTVKEGEG